MTNQHPLSMGPLGNAAAPRTYPVSCYERFGIHYTYDAKCFILALAPGQPHTAFPMNISRSLMESASTKVTVALAVESRDHLYFVEDKRVVMIAKQDTFMDSRTSTYSSSAWFRHEEIHYATFCLIN